MKTLIVFNHPYDGSYCNAILDAALLGLRQSNQHVDIIHLDKDKFNPVMSASDLKAFMLARSEPEKAVAMLDAKVLEYKILLEQAEHLVFIFPIWWMLMPALTKGFIDKVIFPAVAYEYGAKGNMRSRLDKLRRTTVITTMNTPAGVYETVYGNAVKRALFVGTFDAIGLSNCRWLNFDMVSRVSNDRRREWLDEVEAYFADC